MVRGVRCLLHHMGRTVAEMEIGAGWHVAIVYDPQRDRDVMRIRRRIDSMHAEFLCSNGEVIRSEVGEVLPDEVFWTVPEDAFPSLMDALWERGIRPKDRRHDAESDLLREHLQHCRELLSTVMPCALRKEA